MRVLFLVFALFALCFGEIKIASFNVANLFDEKQDGSEYSDFKKGGKKKWSKDKFEKKIQAVARDIKKIMASKKYQIEEITPVDMFPHTVHVETVVLLSQLRQKPDDYIDVDVDVAELEGTSAETKATYEKIKKYVAEHNDGMKVSNLYIAQVKRKCGIELAENFNLPKSEESRQPQCPKEKEEAIIWALKAFKMI